jgi:hypothetical protein
MFALLGAVVEALQRAGIDHMVSAELEAAEREGPA